MKAVLCPVCEGKGKLNLWNYNNFSLSQEKCYGCDGKGWVEVKEDKPIDLVEKLIGQEPEGWNKCPACGQDRNEPPSTGCPVGSHYGSYCEA